MSNSTSANEHEIGEALKFDKAMSAEPNKTKVEIDEEIDRLDEEYKAVAFSKRKLEWEKTALENTLHKKTQCLLSLHTNNERLLTIINEMGTQLAEKEKAKDLSKGCKGEEKIEQLTGLSAGHEQKCKELNEKLGDLQHNSAAVKESIEKAQSQLKKLKEVSIIIVAIEL
jgi:predicted  nucleic acid-binding Zn-ribbon protein